MNSAHAECLSYEDRLPVAVHPATSSGIPGGWQEQNLRVLAAIATLDERPRLDPENGTGAEFERLHRKFDVMVELLGALLRTQSSLPQPQTVRFSSEGLSMPLPEAPPPPGSLQEVELHLHACAPSPWRWHAEVSSHSAGKLQLRFLPMSMALATALERHVFTRHRRSVADARSPARLALAGRTS